MHRPVDFLPPQEPSPNNTTRAPKGGGSPEHDGEPSAFAHALAHLYNHPPTQPLDDRTTLHGHQLRTAQGRFEQVADSRAQALLQGERSKQRFQLGQFDNSSTRQFLFATGHVRSTGPLAEQAGSALTHLSNLRGTPPNHAHRLDADDNVRLARLQSERGQTQRAHNLTAAAPLGPESGDKTQLTHKIQSLTAQSHAPGQASWLQQAKRAERHSAQTFRATERARNLGANHSTSGSTVSSKVGRNSIDLISPAAQLFTQTGSNSTAQQALNAKPFTMQSFTQGGIGQGAQAMGEAMLNQAALNGSVDNSYSAFAALHSNQPLQPLGGGSFAPAMPNPAAQGELNVPLQHPQWGKQLGQNILRIAQQHGTGTQTAQLRLDPPHLGPLHITLHINESQVSAQFFSPHAQVRHSVEQALPQLFEQFNQAGIELGQTHVGSEQQPAHGQGFFAHDGHQPHPHLTQASSASVGHNAALDDTEAMTIRTHRLGAQSLIDTYA